jgi:hypothetical protein
MKTTYLFLVLSAIACSLASCTDKYMEELTLNAPVYLSYEELRSAVGHTSARPLVHPGKIYFKGTHILVVEYLEGVHVIDVSNPSEPQNTGFIEIPGCVDIAVKEQSLYADSFVDLVTIDISDISNPRETKRVAGILPYTVPAVENTEYPCAEIEQDRGVVTGWEVRREKHEIRIAYDTYPMYDDLSAWSMPEAYSPSSGGDKVGGSTSAGIGGSMARFGLYQDYLYIANAWQLYMFDTQTPSSPVSAGTQPLNTNVETMFIHDGHLFFGTPSGMSVYSLHLPLAPAYVGDFWHTTSCDPVVVQDHYAYITLRAGTECGGGVNRLDIVEMSDDYKEYQLVSSYIMSGPHGLGIDGNTLFVCDGAAGLKIYDATDKSAVSSHLLASFPDIQAHDVIPVEGYLFMIGNDGFYLYDYSDYTHIHQIGYIPVAVP